jgi:GMP synthase (glutamine-hydrolysing)
MTVSTDLAMGPGDFIQVYGNTIHIKARESMRKKPSDMRILLLQARNPDDPAKWDELAAFNNKAGCPSSCFISHDLLGGPPTLEQVLQYDALMIGGSGDYNVSDRSLPFLEETFTLLRDVVSVGHPTFASCFGFQLLVEALGGKIVRDAERMEIGTFDVAITDACRQDALFGYLPDAFPAQFGHKERALQLPESVINLGSSERCAYQAIRIPDKPIWATQFHPELSGDENRRRFSRYAEMYVGMVGQDEYNRILARFAESPETEELIPRFLRLIAD